jgi:nucleoside-diphosphate-sugar epimerase
MKTETPNFDLVTLNPPMVYGPIRHTIKTIQDLNQSNARIYDLFINSSATAPLPPNGMPVYTDVRDLADAHILACTVPQASGQRFIVCAGQISSQSIADVLRAGIPELETRTPVGVPGEKGLSEDQYECSSAKAEEVLGLKFRSKEKTFVDLGRQVLEMDKGTVGA